MIKLADTDSPNGLRNISAKARNLAKLKFSRCLILILHNNDIFPSLKGTLNLNDLSWR